ncbi:hypothetical protein TYRP_015374 [Tyrophagus putrescentiae]|nr:hypothetical protein TYRP_015374 [Tyrophagus putrescentiae]
MTAYEIRTPFLRYLLLYYGNLAVQLRPVRLSNPISLLNFLWNFSLTILCFSIAISQIGRFEEEMFEQILEPKAGDFFQQPGQLLSEARTYPNELANRKKLNKPLFDILTKLVLRFAFPTAYGTCLLYFFALSLFSRSNLVELFDSFEVDSFRSRLWSARMTLRIIIATHVNFITVVPSFFWADVRRADWLNPIEVLRLGYTYFTFYVLKFCILLIIGVVFYFRFALYSSLRKIRTDFEVKVSTKNQSSDQGLKCLELRIRKLAFTSWQINQLLSVPLLLITFVYTFDVIIEIASLLLDNNRMDIFYQIALSSNLLIIVYYNEAINWELKVMSFLNITFFCTSLYKVTSESMAYTADEAALPNISRALVEKPLYSLFYSGTLTLGLTSFTLRFVYFLLLSTFSTENCDLVSNLDALTSQVNPGGHHAVSEKRSKQLIFVVITFNHLLYIFCLSEGIFWRLLSYNFGDLAFTYVSFYWMTINMNIAFILLHYTQLGTLHSLSPSKALQSSAFALFFIACHKVFYFIVLVGMVWNFVASGQWNEATVQYISLFPMNTTINSGFILIYYCKYATYKSLEEIINRIQNGCRLQGRRADLQNGGTGGLPRFQSVSTSRKIFFSLLIAHQATFLLTIFWTINHVVQKRPLWYVHLSLEWAQFYILNTNTYISCIITHFYKYCMVESLKLILKNYEREKDIRKLEVELKRLATLNSQLNEVLSFPMIVFIVPYVAEVLITFSLAWLIKLAHVDTYLLQFALHIFTLAYCEVAVQRELTKIFSITANHHKKVSNCDTNLRRSEMNMMTPIRNFELMSLYRDRFQLRLFSLVSINWAFIFALALFVLNYVIFIMQTSF